MFSVVVSIPRRTKDAGADRAEATDVRENVRESAEADDALESELLVLVRRSRPDGCRGLCHDVGGSERGVFGSIPNSSMRLSGICPLYVRETELTLRRDVAEAARFLSDCEESWRTSGTGASSSSLSLQPRPVVRPIPPRRSLPSRCRTRRCTVSRSSLNRPFFVITLATVSEHTQPHIRTHINKHDDPPVDATLNTLPGRSPGSGVVFREACTSFEFGDRRPSLTMSCLFLSVLVAELPYTTESKGRTGGECADQG